MPRRASTPLCEVSCVLADKRQVYQTTLRSDSKRRGIRSAGWRGSHDRAGHRGSPVPPGTYSLVPGGSSSSNNSPSFAAALSPRPRGSRRPALPPPSPLRQPGTGSRHRRTSGEKSLPPLRAMSRCPSKLVARKRATGEPRPAAPGAPVRAAARPPPAPLTCRSAAAGSPPASPAAAPGAGDAEPGPGGGRVAAELSGPRRGGSSLPAAARCPPCPRGGRLSTPRRSAPRRRREEGGQGRGGGSAGPPRTGRGGAAQRHRHRQRLRAAPLCPRPALPAPPRPGRGAPPLRRARNAPFPWGFFWGVFVCWVFFPPQGGPAGAGRAPPVAGEAPVGLPP